MCPKWLRSQFIYSIVNYILLCDIFSYMHHNATNYLVYQTSCHGHEYLYILLFTITVVPDRITPGGVEIKSFRSPISLPSFSSTNLSPSRYKSSVLWNYPRLTAPRDLQIPTPDCDESHSVKVSKLCFRLAIYFFNALL